MYFISLSYLQADFFPGMKVIDSERQRSPQALKS